MSIVGVALKIGGDVYFLSAPFRHNHLIRLLSEKHIDTRSAEQGFVVDDYEFDFIDRDLAERYARANNLLTKPLIGSVLTSEDLW